MGFWHSFGTVGAKMAVRKARNSEEVFWYEGVTGAPAGIEPATG